MFWDVAISALLAILTLVMAYLGVHVTLHPPNESAGTRRKYKLTFLGCAVLSVGLVIWQAIRNSHSQKLLGALSQNVTSLQNKVDGLTHQANTETTRREQAERDLAIMVQATGKSTTEGVVTGFRQIDKEQTLAKISVSVDLLYQDHQLRIYNRGDQNLALWGTCLDNQKTDIEKDPRMISPSGNHPLGIGDGYYYLTGDRLEKYALEKFGNDGSGSLPLKLFLMDAANRKRTINCLLVVTTVQGAVKIETQNLGTVDGWKT